jgi:drug/metabolite transporter (DMT)-like permease
LSWREDSRWAYLFVNLATVFWAGNITLGRVLRDSISPIHLTAARFIIAGVIFAVILKGNLKHLRQLKKDWIILLLMALSGVVGFPILLYLALRYTTASHIAMINGLAPIMTIFLAAIFLGEPLSVNRIVGGVISLIGVSLVISNGSILFLSQFDINKGDLIGLLCALLWGVYSVLSRVATRHRSPLSTSALSTWLALPILISIASLEWQNSPVEFTTPVNLGMLYIGIFPTVVAFWLWNESVRRVGAGNAMAFYNMLPIYGTLFGVTFLREHITWSFFIGGVLVISGSLIAIKKRAIQERTVRNS